MVLLSFLVFFSFHCALILPPLEEVGTKVVDGWQCSVTLCVQANIYPSPTKIRSHSGPTRKRAKLHLAWMGPGRSNNQRRMSKAWIRRQRGAARLGSALASRRRTRRKTRRTTQTATSAWQRKTQIASIPYDAACLCHLYLPAQVNQKCSNGRWGSIPI
jgi:hypothetical protein